jgi:4'-phosphopantetheinyl transferase
MAGAPSAAQTLPGILAPGLIEQKSPIGGVRLWLVDLDGLAGESADLWLSPSEQERAVRFVFPRDARRYRAAHAALRRLLALHCGLSAQSEFEIGDHGKPRLKGRTAGEFNLSHSGGRALIGIGSGDGIGVDIELLRAVDDVWPMAEQNFSADEYAALRRAPPVALAQAFLSIWTRKEACLKAAGVGLSLSPASFEVGLGAEPTRTTLATGQESIDVCVQTLTLGAGMLAAVANILTQPPRDGPLR